MTDTELTAEETRAAEETVTHDQLLHEVSSYRSGMMASESALAEATVLLSRVQQFGVHHPAIRKDIEAFLSRTPAPAAPISFSAMCEGDGPAPAATAEPAEDTEALIEQLDEALCSLLHTGGEIGEHSPRTHLDLFYARSKGGG